MANNSCSVCTEAQRRNIIVDDSHTKVYWAAILGVGEASVRRHFKHLEAGEPSRLAPPIVGLKSNKNQTKEQALGQETTEAATDGSKSVTAVRDRPVTLEDARKWIESTGDDPEDYNLAIKSIAYGSGLFSNKMSAWPRAKKLSSDAESVVVDVDPIAILNDLHKVWKPVQFKESGPGAFVLSINDTQLGKAESKDLGTPETIARVDKFIEMAEARIKELRAIGRKLGTLVLIGGGDIVEGCVIYPNQSYNIDLTRRGQINVAVTLILRAIDRLAPLFDHVVVLVARGNHGENRINGHRTTLYDNDDTLVFEMAQLATRRDPTLQHVKYTIAQDEAGVWTDVAGWRLATTHGDIYGKGVPGASIDKKAENWYKNMSMGRDPLGSADVLITHHYHHDKMSDWGACFWRQTPAQDGGSEYFRQSTGEYSLPGMLTFVMTPEDRYVDEAVLR